MTQHIIIGAGPAGVIAAETLRKQDPQADISMLCDEPEPPYSRMSLPYLLAENIDEAGTYLRKTPNHFASHNIKHIQDLVTTLDVNKKQLNLANGAPLTFDKLLIATGSSPLTPPSPGMDLPGVHHCWTLQDARDISRKALAGNKVVLIGAGFIGSIILEALASRGVDLTVVEMGDRMVPRMMDDISGNMIRRWCENKGVTLHTSTRVDEIAAGKSHRLQIQLDNGSSLDADLVILATGVKPNIGFLETTGIETDIGVLVNERMQSSCPDIYAAGDVCQGKDFSTGEYSVQAIQPTAADHGRIAAMNMAGKNIRHNGSINMNVLDTLGLISASYGLWMGVDGGDKAELCDLDRYRYLSLQFADDVLVGAQSIGMTQHIGVLRGLIQTRLKLGKHKANLMRDPSRLMEAYLGATQAIGYNAGIIS